MSEALDITAWRLVQLKPNCLQIAKRNLLRQGFVVFSPMEETTKRRSGRFVSVTAPLFPGYLFLGSHGGAPPSRVVNSTYGVSRLVSFTDEAPAEVPREIVLGLMARCDDQGMLKPQDVLAPGDNVRVTSGPFADFVGKVEAIGAQQRVWVLLDLLGGATKVAVQTKNLQRS